MQGKARHEMMLGSERMLRSHSATSPLPVRNARPPRNHSSAAFTHEIEGERKTKQTTEHRAEQGRLRAALAMPGWVPSVSPGPASSLQTDSRRETERERGMQRDVRRLGARSRSAAARRRLQMAAASPLAARHPPNARRDAPAATAAAAAQRGRAAPGLRRTGAHGSRPSRGRSSWLRRCLQPPPRRLMTSPPLGLSSPRRGCCTEPPVMRCNAMRWLLSGKGSPVA